MINIGLKEDIIIDEVIKQTIIKLNRKSMISSILLNKQFKLYIANKNGYPKDGLPCIRKYVLYT